LVFISQKAAFFIVTAVKTGWALWWRRNVFPVRYKMRFYIPNDGILDHVSLENKSVVAG
jgi:hypothetical protein